jgi:hypothetical protein
VHEVPSPDGEIEFVGDDAVVGGVVVGAVREGAVVVDGPPDRFEFGVELQLAATAPRRTTVEHATKRILLTTVSRIWA